MSVQPKATFIKDYSKKLSSNICDDFFASNSVIEGKQIVDLIPVRQVNLFVVNTIFFEWQKETAKLRSPFFDYKSSEVKEAYNNLINLLSKNISIERKYFQPILDRAIEDTLVYLLSPSVYFENQFKEVEGKINVAKQIFPTGKYFTIHSDLIKSFFQKLKEEDQKLKGKKILKILEKLIEKESELLDETEDTIEAFSALLELPKEDLIYTAEEFKEKQKEELFNFTENGDDDFEYEDFENVEDKFSKEKEEEEFDEEEEAKVEIETSEGAEILEENDTVLTSEIPADNVEIEEAQEEVATEQPIIPENEISLEDIEEEIKIEEEAKIEEVPAEEPIQKEEEKLPQEKNETPPGYEWNPPVEEKTTEEIPAEKESTISNEFDDDLLDESEFEEPEEKKTDFFEKAEQPKVEVEKTTEETETVLDKIQQTEKVEDEPKENIHSKLTGKVDNEDDDDEKEEENGAYSALLDKLGKEEIKQLKGNISLNLKFKFQNELFGGSNEEFNNAIDLIDGCDNYHSAISLIKERYVNQYNWDFGEESTIEFLSMVDGKY